MALTLSSASAILKVFYLPPLQRQFNTQTILWDRVERNDKWNPEGKNFTLALHYGRHAQAGSGRTSSGATLPAKATQKYANSIVPTAYLYTTIEIEGPIIEHARSNAGSFVRAIRSEVQGASESMRKSLNRQANGDGRDWLGFIRTESSGVSGTLDDSGVGSGTDAAFTYLQPGVSTLCDVMDASETPDDEISAAGTNVAITLGAEAATNFAWTTTDTDIFLGETLEPGEDYFVLAGTFGFQMTGLRSIIATTDPGTPTGGLQGLTVASNTWWKSQIVGSVGSPQDLRFPLLQKVISKVAKNTPNGKDDIKFILTSYENQDGYYELASNERIAVNTMILDGGFEGVEYSGIPIVADPEHWLGVFSFIVPDVLKINQVKDVDWMDRDGNVLSRVSNKDAYEATLYQYINLGTTLRASLGGLVGINTA
jgi:hypothetical protein